MSVGSRFFIEGHVTPVNKSMAGVDASSHSKLAPSFSYISHRPLRSRFTLLNKI